MRDGKIYLRPQMNYYTRETAESKGGTNPISQQQIGSRGEDPELRSTLNNRANCGCWDRFVSYFVYLFVNYWILLTHFPQFISILTGLLFRSHPVGVFIIIQLDFGVRLYCTKTGIALVQLGHCSWLRRRVTYFWLEKEGLSPGIFNQEEREKSKSLRRLQTERTKAASLPILHRVCVLGTVYTPSRKNIHMDRTIRWILWCFDNLSRPYFPPTTDSPSCSRASGEVKKAGNIGHLSVKIRPQSWTSSNTICTDRHLPCTLTKI